MDYDKECPKCGVMLDYVFDKDVVGYWCHRCDYRKEYSMGKLHKVDPKLQVGDKVSTMNTLTRTRLHGIIVDGEYSGGMEWIMVQFDDGVTMWINAEQLEKEE